MRILYLSLSYVPSRRASSVQVMRMCGALADDGHKVTLVTKGCAERQEKGVEDDHAFYGVPPSFELLKLPRPAKKGGGLLFLGHELRLLQQQRHDVDLVFSRDLGAAWLAAKLGLPVLFESHGTPRGWLDRLLHRQLFAAPSFRRLVVISEALKELFARSGFLPPEEKVRVAHDAASPAEPFKGALPDLERGEHGAAGYVGHLYAGRGIELIAELAQRQPGWIFHLIGGAPADLERWRRQNHCPNLVFHGFVPPSSLPAYYSQLDTLLMPYQRDVKVAGGKTDTSAWMSPMKMFEYMATGKPILSSDLPVLREVLGHGHNALLMPPTDPDAWERALERLTAEPGLGQRLGGQAQRDLRERYTWSARSAAVVADLTPAPTR